MHFQIFHDLTKYAAANPDDFNSVSVDILEKFIFEKRKGATSHDQIPVVSASDSSTSEASLF